MADGRKNDFLDTMYLNVLMNCLASASIYDFKYYTEFYIEEALMAMERHIRYLEALKVNLL